MNPSSKPIKQNSRLPSSLTTVTPFSKLFALILFILLPFIGFYLGIQYQKNVTSHTSQPSAIDSWTTFSHPQFLFTFQYPNTWQPSITQNNLSFLDSSSQTIITFSSFNASLVGVTYCGANLSDPRCEGSIDWSSATATIYDQERGMSITLHTVNDTTKDQFRQLVSTFQFLDNTQLNEYSEFQNWDYFNQSYATKPPRNFRFKYPPEFTIINVDSGSVFLNRSQQQYVAIEEIPPLTNNSEGNTEIEKFHSMYKQMNSDYDVELSAIKYQRIALENANFIYKIDYLGEGGCGGGYYNKPQWQCYIVQLNNKGLKLAALQTMPDKIIFQIINSFEFKK